MSRFLIVLAAVAGFALAIDALMVEPYRIEVTHSSIQAPVAPSLKIAHLSDLHTSGMGRRERPLLDLLDAEQPDIIIITGDTITGARGGLAALRQHTPTALTAYTRHSASGSSGATGGE